MPDPSVIERPDAGTKTHPVICEFCECKISLRGRLIEKSAKAKAILDLDDEADRLRKDNERLTAEIAELKKTPEPGPSPTPKRKWASIGDDEDE